MKQSWQINDVKETIATVIEKLRTLSGDELEGRFIRVILRHQITGIRESTSDCIDSLEDVLEQLDETN